MAKLETAITELTKMADRGEIKLLGTEYDYIEIFKTTTGFGASFSFETEETVDMMVYTVDDDVDIYGDNFEEIGDKLIEWINNFDSWKAEKIGQAIFNYEKEQEDIYYMQHII